MTQTTDIKTDKTQKTIAGNPSSSLHIICGSRTGNSMAAATLALDYARHLGIDCHLHDMKHADPSQLQYMKNILIAVSTHGEGDPPAVAENFYDYIHTQADFSMNGSRFSLLALGDSSYADYCKTGHDFRNRLLQMGSTEISPLVECDIDYEENAMRWVREAVDEFAKILPAAKPKSQKAFAFEINKIETENDQLYYATVLEKKNLTHPDYQKRTIHLSLSMDSFGSDFHPGDTFGIYTQNSRLLVDKLIKTLGFDGSFPIQTGDKTSLLKEALLHDFEITVTTPVMVENFAKLSSNKSLNAFIKNKQKVEKYCEMHDVLDLVSDFPPKDIDPQAFTETLRKLAPRLYSVANSPLAYPGELHFTASLMEYPLNSRNHIGVCSTYLADRLEVGDAVPVFLESNEKFRLPADGKRPIIMIGTGTGIAPFRGFLQARKHLNAAGENWLFFGDRHAKSDFLYREEIEQYFNSGLLSRLNTAFSRDQNKKVYVQHHMHENSAVLFEWIDQKQAIVYICGNKRTMGKDVKRTLEEIISREGALDRAASVAYMERMKRDGRLRMDLY